MYPRIDNLEKHIERWDFKELDADEVKGCPYVLCSAVLGSSKLFMSHVERMQCMRGETHCKLSL
jgi:hypothetical protein